MKQITITPGMPEDARNITPHRVQLTPTNRIMIEE